MDMLFPILWHGGSTITCHYCGKSIGREEYITSEGKTYHKECFLQHVAMRCAICGKVIRGKYLQDYWGNIYHAQHAKELPACFYCTRLICEKLTGGGKKYSDGRVICGICLKTAVEEDEEARSLIADVRKRLERYGIKVQGEVSKTYLLDRNKLNKVSGRSGSDSEEAGFTKLEKKTANGKLLSFNIQIFILEGLPETHFIATAAHELMHVWQHLYAVPENDKQLREGSCNFAAYLVLKDLHTAEANYIIKTYFENKDRVYGKGFVKVYNLVKKRGIKGWLFYLRENKKLPLFL
jgi:uncharacterized Zn finger protein (UPF0148 family)